MPPKVDSLPIKLQLLLVFRNSSGYQLNKLQTFSYETKLHDNDIQKAQFT